MKKSIKESKRANTKAGKQACTRLAGQHPNIKGAPENKLFSKQEKKTKMQEIKLNFTHRKNYLCLPPLK